jgi:transposase InsO family protein
VKFAFVKEHRRVWPVGVICRVLGVTRSGFYAWMRREPSARQLRREELAEKIIAAHQANRRVYGSPRIHRELVAGGEKVCRNTVARIMKQRKIRGRIRRRYVPRTTDSRHGQAVAWNVLDRQFNAERINSKWVADLTYVPTQQGWLYLAAVMDLCSRRIVGWSMADHMRVELAADALKMALAWRRPAYELLHHSDRGVQYASEDYQSLLAEHKIQCSMSGKGNCYDNAAMESFFATLKTELVHEENYGTHEEARASIFEYIEVFYNRNRRHSSLGYLSPEAFEAGHK